MFPDGVAKRFLVLSRIGADHRLHGLLGISRLRRNWDLALSLYDEDVVVDTACVEYLDHRRGGKWDGMHAFFAEHPEVLDTYDYFWLVDDDIEATAEQVDRLFAYVAAHRFDLAQPALTLDSFYSHRLTLQCAVFRHRHTNFVELMMPVMSRNLLRQVLRFFADNRSGLGLDWLWQRFAADPARSVAIIDAVAMPHYRPLNQHLRARLARDGISAHDERGRAMREWSVRRVYPVAFAGEQVDGDYVSRRATMARMMTSFYWANRQRITRRPWRWLDFPLFAILQSVSGCLPAGARRTCAAN